MYREKYYMGPTPHPPTHTSYGDIIDRERLLTNQLVDQGYTLEKLKVYFRKFYGRCMLCYNITILPFHNFCVT